MKPPICVLCGKEFQAKVGGNLILFADYVPLSKDIVGHPQGAEWFCSEQAAEAMSCSDMKSDKAIQVLKERARSTHIVGTSISAEVVLSDPNARGFWKDPAH